MTPALNDSGLNLAITELFLQILDIIIRILMYIYLNLVNSSCTFIFSDESNEFGESDEIVEDPTLTNNLYLHDYPKKASLKAILNEDPRVLATVIEDDRINDIYFTSKL